MSSSTLQEKSATQMIKPKSTNWPIEKIIIGAVLIISLIFFVLFLIAPLSAILSQLFVNNTLSEHTGISALFEYLQSPSILRSLWNSIWVSVVVTMIVIPLAFTFAYALTRSCLRFKGIYRSIALLPLLAPSLLSAISIIYWFGNQGAAKAFWNALGFNSIYGAPGIILAEIFAIFPHVLMILVTALTLADQRLYEAADTLGTSKFRKFITITLPSVKYGLVSAGMVSFTLVITDFGIPKIVGGNFDVLATDLFRMIIGQQNFQQGAAVALLLLIPALLTFTVEHHVRKKQISTLSARSVRFSPKKNMKFDLAMNAYVVVISCLMLAMLLMAVYASFVSFWPYNLKLSLLNYESALFGSGLGKTLLNSLTLALGTTIIGTALVFLNGYMLEKTKGFGKIKLAIRLMATLPVAIPGLVLGLGYIFFFNSPSNPFNFLYHSMLILILCTVVHFYTTSHMTMTSTLKSIDWEFEAVSQSLKVPFYKTMWRVTLPISLPTLLDISRYFFINAMTTISAVIFLYSPETELAAVAILNLDDAGDVGGATAMAVMITGVSLVVISIYYFIELWIKRSTHRWANH